MTTHGSIGSTPQDWAESRLFEPNEGKRSSASIGEQGEGSTNEINNGRVLEPVPLWNSKPIPIKRAIKGPARSNSPIPSQRGSDR